MVSARLNSGSGNNASLSGNTEILCQAGICRFTDLSLDKAGTSYVLEFSSYLFSTVLSDVFFNNGPAKLQIAQEPGGSIVGRPFIIQPTVTTSDVFGNLLSQSLEGLIVTVQIKQGTGNLNSYLGGTTCISIKNGSAAYTDLWLDNIGSRYVLRFSSVDLESVESKAFDTEFESRMDVCDSQNCISAVTSF